MLVANLVISSPAMAEEIEEQEGTVTTIWSAEMEIGEASSNVDERSGWTISEKPTTQACVTLSHVSGVYAFGYGSLDSEFDLRSGTREFSGGVGYNRQILKVDTTFEYEFYKLYGGQQVSAQDFHILSLELVSPSISGVTFVGKLEADIPADGSEGGWFWGGGIRYTQPIMDQPIDLELFVGGNDGAYGVEPEVLSYGRVTVATSFELGNYITVTPSMFYQTRFHENGLADDKFVVMLNFKAEKSFQKK